MKSLSQKFKVFLLYFHTMRYLRSSQYVYRMLYKIKFLLYPILPGFWQRIYALKPKTVLGTQEHPILLKGLYPDPFDHTFEDCEAILTRAEDVLRSEFFFLNHRYQFSDQIDWHCQDVNHLWRYQLHYFDYAWDLGIAYRISGKESFYDQFKYLVESWDLNNPFGTLDGWHPYTLSLRVVNWLYAIELFEPALKQDKAFSEKLLRLVYCQCQFLFHNLEFHGLGNHLLANIKTLIMASAFFDHSKADAWLDRGLKLLYQELDEQVLTDGGHFERSPMYHLIVLKDLIACYGVVEKTKHVCVHLLKDKIVHMQKFAEALLMPDGRLPLMNDGGFDLMPDAPELIDLARSMTTEQDLNVFRSFSYLTFGGHGHRVAEEAPKKTSTSLDAAGYFVMQGGAQTCLVLDCGDVCPDYLPPHAHADTLSFDLWVAGRPMIVDSGTFEYTAGKWRNFFRSTYAHNTVVVDGQDQSEVWGSFRVGRRAYPKDVVWISQAQVDYFAGTHTGYERLSPSVYHRRHVLFLRDRFWVVVDEISGQGHHTVESLIHLHPEVTDSVGDAGQVYLKNGQAQLSIWPFGCQVCDSFIGSENPPQGWYSPEFGVKQPRKTFVLGQQEKPVTFFGYMMVLGQVESARVQVECAREAHFEVEVDNAYWDITVDLEQEEICVMDKEHL